MTCTTNISPDEKSRPPFISICKIVGIREDGREVDAGTGWLIDPETVVTAAHVIEGKPRYSISFPQLPEPLIVDRSHARIHEYYKNPMDLYDYGVINIPALQDRTPISARFGISLLLGQDASSTISLAGYEANNQIGTPTLCSTDDYKPTIRALHSSMDTDEGVSGAPVFFWRREIPEVAGVHVGMGLRAVAISINKTVRNWIIEAAKAL
jgi:V8-like Glu-specific endopeptidase